MFTNQVIINKINCKDNCKDRISLLQHEINSYDVFLDNMSELTPFDKDKKTFYKLIFKDLYILLHEHILILEKNNTTLDVKKSKEIILLKETLIGYFF